MKQFFYVCLLLFLVSCSNSVKGSWSCPTLEGGKGNCASIKDADLVESKDKTNFTYLDSTQKIEINLVAPKLSELRKIQKENNQLVSDLIKPKTRYRTEERVGRIWFAPHIDSEGNQHSERVVYIVDEEPRWVTPGASLGAAND